ncbi:hypothetical protein K461DRAFT_223216 [Myriangium duriaei CBS 260.36]|uniref:TPR-like protein n=1 Tax=Myriangium duriaei CBS 260.36 TaxID=1168546 RepID=A0A9P4J768_9PEZI|nr:hypothetical protein K461DRAFT_223216 [Myriangium duriaei CBS 260.36]
MWDTLLSGIFDQLPSEVSVLLQDHLTAVEEGRFESILRSEQSQLLFGHCDDEKLSNVKFSEEQCWSDYIFRRLGLILSTESSNESRAANIHSFFLLGYTALLSFLQSNCTGPPLPFSCTGVILGPSVAGNKAALSSVRTKLLESLATDGVAAYRLTPNIELLCLADTILSNPTIKKSIPLAEWARLRTTFVHQRILSEHSSTLHEQILQSLDQLDELISQGTSTLNITAKTDFLLEKASIETYYGNDKQARSAINDAAKERNFAFALVGRLGKRTKYQERDVSQLVVLARSHDTESSTDNKAAEAGQTGPKNLDLNDDTLLEAISFTTKSSDPAKIVDDAQLPAALSCLDPSKQPLLDPNDSVILLSLASAITNTSPEDGLTREETLPYATRVLEGGSSNWQIYTQALLVRSRIEGYKSRTVERGLLQLQTLVDQVILDTTPTDVPSQQPSQSNHESKPAPTIFLPQAKEGESAPATERLKYVFQLGTQTRWDLEAELAQRWVQLGGLRSALEIYERLELWAEAALCWAATQREDKAKRIVRKMLYHATDGKENSDNEDEENWDGPERNPLPADAPRLFCILGDIDSDPAMYERAWEVSGQHYARAQRSLGRMYISARDYLKAAAAYSRSLHVNRLNHSSWFAFGCALLELEEFEKAVEAFTRCVQLDERDAEAWSNLAAALLRQAKEPGNKSELTSRPDPQKWKHDALRALKRAAALKHDSFQIWENVMIVAASVSPPDYSSAIAAQSSVIDLRGKTVGEKCVDAEIMAIVVRGLIASSEQFDPNKPGPERMLMELFDRKIQPLITASPALWSLVAKLAVWRKKPATGLDAHEKGWRTVITQPGWETDSEARWDLVVDATVELCDAYESLGPMETTEGLGAGQALVAKDWKFKARSAVRGIMGRGRNSFEGTAGWTRLQETLDGLKS